MEKVSPEPMSGCWLWLGALDTHGYGNMWDGEHHTKGSRVAWALFRGPIPLGLRVLHRCDNPPCVNPDHLFLGTQLDNVVDMHAKGRARNGMEGRDHCVRGHPYSAKRIERSGKLGSCRVCEKERLRVAWLRKKARIHAERRVG